MADIPSVAEPMLSPALTSALLGGLVGLAIAAALYFKDWLTNKSLRAALENLSLRAEIAQQERAISVEADKAQAALLSQVAIDAAATKEAQAVIGVKVDGRMSELNAEIAALRNALQASQLAVVTEKDKAVALATAPTPAVVVPAPPVLVKEF